MKTCCVCKLEKPFTEFYPIKDRKSGYLSRCKQCESERCKRKTKLYKENRIEKAKAWRNNNKDAFCASVITSKEKNPDKYREIYQIWKDKNRAKVNAKWMAREAAKKQQTPSWLAAIDKAQIESFYEIALARTTQTGIKHHVDHIVPICGKIVSGLHVPWNLQVLTASDNQRKSNKLVA